MRIVLMLVVFALAGCAGRQEAEPAHWVRVDVPVSRCRADGAGGRSAGHGQRLG
uniref:Lipoprotein n=1 Tax=Pseudomonas phage PACT201 TaxID=3230130 RepID=A0AAU8GSA6_9VIRU